MITENELNEIKWFDYRAITPEGCNLIFAHEWLDAREKFLQRTKVDVRFDENGKAYRKQLPFSRLIDLQNSGVWLSLVELRRRADKHMIPYYLFWSCAYRMLEDFSIFEGEVEFIANNTIATSSLLELVNEIKEARILLSEKDYLKAGNFIDLPLQVQYMNYLRSEVHSRYPATAAQKLEVLKIEGRYVEPSIYHLMDERKTVH
jgi:hypothetical protein